jgi:hypothetical protein
LRDEELPILVPVDFGDLVPVTEEHSRLLSRHTLPGIVDDLVEVAPIHDDLRAARPRFSTRHHGRMVLHTSHPIPGLRVDDLRFPAQEESLNERRHAEAEARVRAAAQALRQQGEAVTVSAVARLTGANKGTVGKVLGQPVHTLKREIGVKRALTLPWG